MINARVHHTLEYRADIDGLRALAVFLVVLFHGFPDIFKAGFIGVDIFFVISGYLIGGIIFLNLRDGTFSFKEFYYRRILRIFPALTVLLTVVAIAGYFLFIPPEIRSLGKHLVTSSLFAENFWLWKEHGYFDIAAHFKPLLNLWSLGIEEQFYIVFPFLFYFFWKKRFNLELVIGLLCLLSFIASIYIWELSPSADFYSPLTRFWELFAGALLKIAEQSTSYKNVINNLNKIYLRSWMLAFPVREREQNCNCLLFSAGLFLIIICFFVINSNTPYPGWHAVFPVLAAVCFLAAGPYNIFSKLFFSNRFMVFSGKISYPFYLWHWPLISFAFIINTNLDNSTTLLRLILILSAYLLAIATYFCIEYPVRFKKCLGKSTIPVLIFAMSSNMALGLWFYGPVSNTSLAKELEEPASLNEAGKKYLNSFSQNFDFRLYDDQKSNETIALIGDSHAWLAFYGMKHLAEKITNTGKKPFNTITLSGPGLLPEEDSNANQILSFLMQHNEIKKVILISREKHFFKDNAELQKLKVKEYEIKMEKFIKKLQNIGKEIVIISANPELPLDIKLAYKRGSIKKTNIDKKMVEQNKIDVLERQKIYRKSIKNIAHKTGIDILDTFDILCPAEKCIAFNEDDHPLYYDIQHLSYAGNKLIAEKLMQPWLIKKGIIK